MQLNETAAPHIMMRPPPIVIESAGSPSSLASSKAPTPAQAPTPAAAPDPSINQEPPTDTLSLKSVCFQSGSLSPIKNTIELCRPEANNCGCSSICAPLRDCGSGTTSTRRPPPAARETSRRACAGAAPVSRDDPEGAESNQRTISSAAGLAVVVTAHPLATVAAHTMLMKGGSAVDALVAAQTVLAVVEPQSSGLGGGGFLLHWNARQQTLEVLDGREQAPSSSQPDDLLRPDGGPIPWREASSQLRAIGIPGTVALLWDAHQRWGRLPWTTTFQPAIKLARKGFRTTPRLLRSIGLAQRKTRLKSCQTCISMHVQPPALPDLFDTPGAHGARRPSPRPARSPADRCPGHPIRRGPATDPRQSTSAGVAAATRLSPCLDTSSAGVARSSQGQQTPRVPRSRQER